MVLKWVASIDERHVFKLPNQEYLIQNLTDILFITTSFVTCLTDHTASNYELIFISFGPYK